jgi:hypothetical protein
LRHDEKGLDCLDAEHVGSAIKSSSEVSGMVQAQRIVAVPGWGMSLIAGIGAGIIAALVGLGLEYATGARLPPHLATAWSAFVAGVLGGLLYGGLSRITSRPVPALWIITLVLATIDSLLIITQALPEGQTSVAGIPIVGLMVPLRQAAALAGLGHFSARHFPREFLPVDTAVHYTTAVVVSLLVPWWAKPRGR